MAQVWADPLKTPPPAGGGGGAAVTAAGWRTHMRTAWDFDPRLALALLDRRARHCAPRSPAAPSCLQAAEHGGEALERGAVYHKAYRADKSGRVLSTDWPAAMSHETAGSVRGQSSTPASFHARHAPWRARRARPRRLPGAAAARGEAEQLAAAHATDPDVQALPRAAALLATPGASIDGGVALQQCLAAWAPAPLLQARAHPAAPPSEEACLTLAPPSLAQGGCLVPCLRGLLVAERALGARRSCARCSSAAAPV